jgi:hypothetical protein
MRVGIALSIAAATRRLHSNRAGANMEASATCSNSKLSRQWVLFLAERVVGNGNHIKCKEIGHAVE